MGNGLYKSVGEINTQDSNCASGVQPCSPGCGTGASPFYNQAGAIQETHCQSTTVQQFVASLALDTDFVMPACDTEAIITFSGLAQIQIGSYLWSVTYGYLNVTGFDSLSGEVTVMNECQAVNAAPGTVVPRCTLFNVVDPPCNCS